METKGGLTVASQDNFKGAKLPYEKLDANVRYIRSVFSDDDTLVTRFLSSPFDSALKFCLIYADGMVNNKLLNDDVIRPLLQYRFPEEHGCLTGIIAQNVMFSDDVKQTDDMEAIVQGIVYGDTVLLADGCADSLVLNTKGWNMRSIEEPESERVLRGPREGFNESMLVNLSMIRRRIRTPDLKFRYLTFGRRTRTKACLCYLDSVVNKHVLEELKKRLAKIDIDGTLDTEYIMELIRDKPYAPVETVGSTERPDVVAGRLLEGRVALVLDGTPQVMTVPFLLIEDFQSDEDYCLNYYFASLGRILRILAFLASTGLPAIYVSLATFHQDMLPAPLLVSISQARQGVPFPTILEMLFMLVVFEMLREAGARMPGIMGQTLSIVGALVVGQAAVAAKIVSAPIIIIVGVAGITGLMVPRLKSFTILVRFAMLALASVLGLYGFLYGRVALLILLYGMDSFGVPLMGNSMGKLKNTKDIYIRAPWWMMITRPKELTKNRIRQNRGSKKK
ncbi:MAG: spore germination protein [Oscillospiraceae bacterium]|jgi:spore germination protein KA|nr:spore germination protein [Oscillospiraceae bacterium]